VSPGRPEKSKDFICKIVSKVWKQKGDPYSTHLYSGTTLRRTLKKSHFMWGFTQAPSARNSAEKLSGAAEATRKHHLSRKTENVPPSREGSAKEGWTVSNLGLFHQEFWHSQSLSSVPIEGQEPQLSDYGLRNPPQSHPACSGLRS
jgi:hypothetical protein